MWNRRMRNLGIGLATFVALSLAVAVGTSLGQIAFTLGGSYLAGLGPGCLSWITLVQQILLAGILWASIGIFGSYYVLRTVAWSPKSEEPRREWIELPASTEKRIRYFPPSARELRLSGLVFCGLFGLIALLLAIALCFAGSLWPRTRLLAQLYNTSPRWLPGDLDPNVTVYESES